MPSDWYEMQDALEEGNFVINDLFPITAACYISRKWEGEPLWILAVAPGGSGKTVTVDQFAELEKVENAVIVSSITPAALISGYGGKEGADPSLMNRLHNKILIAKDFGTIMSMGSNQVNEIFGILREAFDGKVKKTFGHMERVYDPIHFNFLALTTEACERVSVFRQQLGERFMRFNVEPPNLPSPPPKINESLKAYIADWLLHKEEKWAGRKPELETDTYKWIGEVAQTTAKLRTNVIHDGYSKEVLEIPGFEGSARLEKQLTKLYQSLYVVMDNDKSEIRRLCKHAAQSSVKPRKLKVLKYILRCNDNGVTEDPSSDKLHKYPTITDVAEETRHGYQVVRRLLRDLYVLELMDKKVIKSPPKTYGWSLPSDFKRDLKCYFEKET